MRVVPANKGVSPIVPHNKGVTGRPEADRFISSSVFQFFSKNKGRKLSAVGRQLSARIQYVSTSVFQ